MVVKFDPEEVETGVIHELVDFNGKDALEIGCGNGCMTWRFADEAASVLALDPKEAEIAAAKERIPDALKATVSFQVADSGVDLLEGAFDVAIIPWSL